jgi:hypothetical protein
LSFCQTLLIKILKHKLSTELHIKHIVHNQARDKEYEDDGVRWRLNIQSTWLKYNMHRSREWENVMFINLFKNRRVGYTSWQNVFGLVQIRLKKEVRLCNLYLVIFCHHFLPLEQMFNSVLHVTYFSPIWVYIMTVSIPLQKNESKIRDAYTNFSKQFRSSKTYQYTNILK